MDQESLETKEDIGALLATYANMLYRVAFSRTQNKSDAEDVVQEVFLRYLRSNTYFGNEEYRKAWLLMVPSTALKAFLPLHGFVKPNLLTRISR